MGTTCVNETGPRDESGRGQLASLLHQTLEGKHDLRDQVRELLSILGEGPGGGRFAEYDREKYAGERDGRVEAAIDAAEAHPDVVADLNRRIGDRDRRIAELEDALAVDRGYFAAMVRASERERCTALVDHMADEIAAQRARAAGDGDGRTALYSRSAEREQALRAASAAIRGAGE